MSREHTGTIQDGDVEEAYRQAEEKLARDPRGFILMKLPTWFVVQLLNAYSGQKALVDAQRKALDLQEDLVIDQEISLLGE